MSSPWDPDSESLISSLSKPNLNLKENLKTIFFSLQRKEQTFLFRELTGSRCPRLHFELQCSTLPYRPCFERAGRLCASTINKPERYDPFEWPNATACYPRSPERWFWLRLISDTRKPSRNPGKIVVQSRKKRSQKFFKVKTYTDDGLMQTASARIFVVAPVFIGPEPQSFAHDRQIMSCSGLVKQKVGMKFRYVLFPGGFLFVLSSRGIL